MAAAKKGADVTCVDLSPSMLNRVKKKFEADNLQGEFVHSNVLEYKPEIKYDFVCANFFLNVFSESVMNEILAHISGLVTEGGMLCIADFAPYDDSYKGGIFRLLHSMHYSIAIYFYWSLQLMALHPIYDYSTQFETLGLKLKNRKDFPLTPWGPYSYCSWIGQKTGAED